MIPTCGDRPHSGSASTTSLEIADRYPHQDGIPEGISVSFFYRCYAGVRAKEHVNAGHGFRKRHVGHSNAERVVIAELQSAGSVVACREGPVRPSQRRRGAPRPTHVLLEPEIPV